MLNRFCHLLFLTFGLLFPCLATPFLSAAEEPNTQILPPSQVIRVATALNHISIIQLPEPILSAAIGSNDVRMEWHDSRVLLQPLKPGIATNLTVWTARISRTYEILPAGDTASMSYLIDEVLPAPPPPPPGPSPAEVEKNTDAMVSSALVNTRSIRKLVRFPKNQIHLEVKAITEDDRCYYVSLAVLNRSAHPYRITDLQVISLEPTFARTVFERFLYRQISDKTLARFGRYSTRQLRTHGSTLTLPDLAPGRQTSWVIAVNKPDKTAGIYRFSFSTDGDSAAGPHAIAVF